MFVKPLQKFHFNLVTPLILDSPATLPEGPWGGPRMPATGMAVLKIPMQSQPHAGVKEHFRHLSHYKYYLFKTLSFIGRSYKKT